MNAIFMYFFASKKEQVKHKLALASKCLPEGNAI